MPNHAMQPTAGRREEPLDFVKQFSMSYIALLIILALNMAFENNGLAADETQKVANVKKALAIYAPRPQYPYEARRRRQIGAGLAILDVDPNTGPQGVAAPVR
jgi:hypothetical protein